MLRYMLLRSRLNKDLGVEARALRGQLLDLRGEVLECL